jgi:hypothetical protein
MDAKLREYLKKNGVSDQALDQIERGIVPDDPDVLRKRADDDPCANLRKIDEMLKEIKGGLERIEKQSAHRAACARGEALFNADQMNGGAHKGIDLLAALTKGTNP